MTDKEEILEEIMITTLENCKLLAEWEGGEFIDDLKRFSEAFKEIKKDLEMLELIKKLFVYDEYMGFDIDFRKLKESERNKIKEWLK